MFQASRIAQAAAIALAALAAPAFAAATVDANAEFDTGTVDSKDASAKGSFQGGRIETNVAGRAEGNGGFVAGRGTVIMGRNGGASIDDAWVQLGTSSVDVKLGRFEAADLYGTPADVVRIGGVYQTNTLRGRDDNRVHAAVTFNAAPGVSVELGLVDKQNTAAAGAKGVRPVVSYASGPLSLKVGMESGKIGDGTKEYSFSGTGAAVSYALGRDVTLRANLSHGSFKYATESKKSAVLVGVDVGAFSASYESGESKDGAVTTKVSGLFAGYTLPLFGIKGASLTPALGTGTTKMTGAADVTTTKVAVRVHYDF